MKRGFFQREEACKATTKRRRDRAYPIDALSRMMWESTIGKKKTGAMSPLRCATCYHCERAMASGEYCCVACTNAFCGECSTINYSKAYDRVFCLDCPQDE
ncbi:hypothetical protein SPRG_19771 [Saprolegnia parasitica CBS 223.65]|uniref:Uncharacterized protein n=1 Tax=Saprolegnia parasitica (strain CBS 223.65) TaxID=695850 RepID=A0A067CUM9_SAPPC|nr:hypothetical protein SPRG_19771 [Saprolegnia parasitica CBS 223.65]KDO30211.1 hypothetical protein SPRG_19771 [Saprolegnia parasitica CBS 223.65]|eukprot:XP_012199026.1 hypothetical protein SPRG_19771 [Saprolegnia parasitica CBS 223.65]